MFIGIVIAWLFNPFVSWLEEKKVKRIFGVVLTYLIIFLILYLTLSSLIPVLMEQITEMVRMSPHVFETIKGWALGFFDHLERYDVSLVSQIKANFFSMFERVAIDITTNMPSNLFNFVSKFFSFLGTFILGLIIVLLFSFLGNQYALKYKRKRNFFIELENFIIYLKREISFSGTTLGNIVKKYKTENTDLLDMLNTIFCECREDNIYYPKYLDVDEKQLIQMFFDKLGKSDKKNEIELLDNIILEIRSMKEKEIMKSSKITGITTKLGFLVGAIVFVMLL